MLNIKNILKEFCWQKWLDAVRNKDKQAKDFWWNEFFILHLDK